MEETYQNIAMLNMKKEDEEVVSKWDMIQVGEDSEESSDSSMASSSCLSTDSEVEADASSSSSSLSSANGPLFHLTDLMNQLPMRRGLSKHYKGKSQSFTSLAHVKNLEDLAKKVSPYGTALISSSSYDRRRMKSCKSYAVFAEATITYK